MVFEKKIEKLFEEAPGLSCLNKKEFTQILEKNHSHPLKALCKSLIEKGNNAETINQIISKDIKTLNVNEWYILNHYYWGRYFLSYLSRCILRLNGTLRFPRTIKRLTRNLDEFWETISEIEFNAYFATNYETELQYLNLDSKIKIKNRNILFEIFTPRICKQLEDNPHKAIFLENRSEKIIITKLNNQINKIENQIQEPIIIVINISHSEIDLEDIKNALWGSAQCTLEIPKNPKNPIPEPYWSRANDSINITSSRGHLISGILVYKIDHWVEKSVFSKNLLLNPHALFPLTNDEITELEKFDLNQI